MRQFIHSLIQYSFINLAKVRFFGV